MNEITIELRDKSDFDPIELSMWFQGGFLRQILDIYPEVYRLENYENDKAAFQAQWNILVEFISMTMLDDNVDDATKYELLHNLEKLRDYYVDRSVNKNAAFGWWKQWKYDLNRTVARQGYQYMHIKYCLVILFWITAIELPPLISLMFINLLPSSY